MHFLLSVSGVQVCEGTKDGAVSRAGTCTRGERARDCEPFLNPHVLFFFVQEPHWLHSPSSHAEARWPGGRYTGRGGREWFTAPASHICFAAFPPAHYSSVVLARDNDLRWFPNLKAILCFWPKIGRLRRLWTWKCWKTYDLCMQALRQMAQVKVSPDAWRAPELHCEWCRFELVTELFSTQIKAAERTLLFVFLQSSPPFVDHNHAERKWPLRWTEE